MFHILQRAALATTANSAKVSELLLWLPNSVNSTGIVELFVRVFPLEFAFSEISFGPESEARQRIIPPGRKSELR